MSDGEWGLSLGEQAKEMMINHVGWSFIPLYQIFGPLSMLFIMLIFVVGLLRFVITFPVRIVVITRARGCGVWVLAAVWGTLYQLVITPIRWAEDTVGRMAKDVERRMEHEAEAGSMYEIPMRRLREVGEEAWPQYQAAARLFRGEVPRAPPRGLEAYKSDE